MPTTRADLLIDRAWSNITPDVYSRGAVTITRGRADEASRPEPSTCRLTLNNRSGKYSPRNPTSALYGKIGRNTPLRFGVGLPSVAAAATSSVSSTSLVAPSVTAEASGLLLCLWVARPFGNITVPGGFTALTETDAVITARRGHKTVAAGATGTATATFSTTATEQAALSVHIPGGVLAANITGATAGADLAAVSMTPNEGDLIVAMCGWSADPTGRMQPLRVSTPVGAGWLLVADTGPSTGIRVACWIRRSMATESPTMRFVGPVNPAVGTFLAMHIVTGAAAYYPRHVGEVASWPQSWEAGGRDAYTAITSAGVLRRLGQGPSPLKSALRRELPATPNLVEYWPMEDAAGSGSFASGNGGAPLRFTGGTPLPGAVDGPPGSDPIPTFTGAQARANARGTGLSVGVATFSVGALMTIPAAGMTNNTLMLSVYGTGSIEVWRLTYLTAGGGQFLVEAFGPGDTILSGASTTGPLPPPLNGATFFVYLTADFDGLNTPWTLVYVPIVDTATTPTATTVASGTVTTNMPGNVRTVIVGSTGLTGGPAIGHVVIASGITSLNGATLRAALIGHAGETAAERIRRLCTEESIPCHVQEGATSAAMGPQLQQRLRDLLDECVTTDGGDLYEPAGFLGLAYRTRASLTNQRGL